jgi:hypothetical protein
LAVLVVVGCSRPPPPVVRQIKSAPELAAPTAVAPYEVGSAEIRIDGRVIAVAGDGPLDGIARDFARVPRPLRDLLQTLAISAVPSPNDAYFAAKYKLPVNAGMATGSHGDITIASDPSAPSAYARTSYRSSGAPDEDAAEATALYFLVLGTPAFDAYRAAMPKRFGLIATRFAIIER